MKLSSFILSCLLLFLPGVVMSTSAQTAKKPKIIIVPSDALLNKMGLLNQSEDMGEVNYVANYKKFFLDDEAKACISKFNEMMADRGYPMISLESELKKVQSGKKLTVASDIKVGLNYNIKKRGPEKLLYAEFEAVDNYSSKPVAAASGESSPAIGVTTINLLQEAVLSNFDKFCNSLQSYFDDVIANGRETSLSLVASDIDLTEDNGGKSILDETEEWLKASCVNGAYSLDSEEENKLDFSQARIPLFDAQGKGMDARNFYKGLVKHLNSFLAPRGLKAKAKSEGLGDVTITISQ